MAHDVFQNAGRRPPAPNIKHITTTYNTNLHKDKDTINKEHNLNATYSYPPQLFYASFSTNSAVAATHQNLEQNKTVTKVTTIKPNSTNDPTSTVFYDIAPTHPDIQNSTTHQQLNRLDRQKHRTTEPATITSTNNSNRYNNRNLQSVEFPILQQNSKRNSRELTNTHHITTDKQTPRPHGQKR
jgi:hypothetical protein